MKWIRATGSTGDEGPFSDLLRVCVFLDAWNGISTRPGCLHPQAGLLEGVLGPIPLELSRLGKRKVAAVASDAGSEPWRHLPCSAPELGLRLTFLNSWKIALSAP